MTESSDSSLTATSKLEQNIPIPTTQIRETSPHGRYIKVVFIHLVLSFGHLKIDKLYTIVYIRYAHQISMSYDRYQLIGGHNRPTSR